MKRSCVTTSGLLKEAKKETSPPFPVKLEEDDYELFPTFEEDETKNWCEENLITTKSKYGTVCPLEIGTKAAQASPESMKLLQQQITKATLCQMKFNTTALDELYDKGSGETKATCLMMRGLMTIMENTHNRFMTRMEKWAKENSEADHSDIRVSLDPMKVKNHESKVSVRSYDGKEEIDANEIISLLPFQSGLLRQVVYSVSNHWINSVVPEQEMIKLTISTKPQQNLIQLPWRFLNAPTGLFLLFYLFLTCIIYPISIPEVLVNCLTLDGKKDIGEISDEIAGLLKHHVKNRFNHMRHASKRVIKRRADGEAKKE
uniref:Uncharacterized protein n=1 Tax=Caenorhabditis japonica TaxID=281687 RepID=A0A8R1IRB7_CAEJA